jgi:hypothetical protein
MKNLEQSREHENNLTRIELETLESRIRNWNSKKLSYEKKKPSYEYADELSKKTRLTDEECKFLAKFDKDNWWPLTLSITTITDKQAEILSDVRTLQLNWLTTITDRQVESLTKDSSEGKFKILALDWLRTITDKQAKCFSKCVSVFLGWLTSITDRQTEYLWNNSSDMDMPTLHLSWLTRITDKQAENLSHFKGTLYLGWLTSITDKQAENLSKVRSLDINTRILTQKQGEILNK